MTPGNFSFSLLCLLFYGRCTVAFSVSNFTGFIKHEDIGGLTYSVDQYGFDPKERMSLTECVLKCSEITKCYGIFHHPQSLRCVGCQDQFFASEGAQSHSGTLYYRRKTYKVVEQELRWTDSQRHCEDLVGRLLDIKSQAEQTFMESHFFQGYNVDFRLGAADIESEGIFVWRDGTISSDNYLNWQSNQPNNHENNEHCMKTSKIEDGMKWRDARCEARLFSICEFD